MTGNLRSSFPSIDGPGDVYVRDWCAIVVLFPRDTGIETHRTIDLIVRFDTSRRVARKIIGPLIESEMSGGVPWSKGKKERISLESRKRKEQPGVEWGRGPRSGGRTGAEVQRGRCEIVGRARLTFDEIQSGKKLCRILVCVCTNEGEVNSRKHGNRVSYLIPEFVNALREKKANV